MNNSLGLPPAHSLSVCLFLWFCVVCVYFSLYISFCLCCERCVFCVWFLSACLLFWFLRMCIYTNIGFSLLSHIRTHFLPYSSVCICILLYTIPIFFLLFPKHNRHLCYGVYWCNHTLPNIPVLWFLLYFHFVFCISTIVRTGIKITYNTNLHV